jgi:leucyl-tRNA synthetase
MPQWAGSCWYYLRYLDPHNEREPWSQEAESYWMPVDLYVGGAEHAVLHLLYARFWHKVLYDCGLVHTREPFQRLFNQGMILAEYGADALRLYELFMGPLEQQKPWQTKDVEGVYRFLQRVWRLVVDEDSGELNPRLTDAPGASEPELWKLLHRTADKVGKDIETLAMNTAISQMMIWSNAATSSATLPRESVAMFLAVLAPFAPHLAEELWSRLGERELLCRQQWPAVDPALLVDDTIQIVVQVNGKKRDVLDVATDADGATVERLALASENAQRFLEGKAPRKVIVVPGRLVNIVV